MKVRAVEAGFYDLARRKPGDVFKLTDDSHFSSRWMEKIKDPEPDKDVVDESPPEETGKRDFKGSRKVL